MHAGTGVAGAWCMFNANTFNRLKSNTVFDDRMKRTIANKNYAQSRQ